MRTAQRNTHLDPERLLAASARFRGFVPEPERIVRAGQAQANPKIEAMKAVWKDAGDWDEFIAGEHPLQDTMLGALKGLAYTSKDVEEFSLSMACFQGTRDFSERAGVFLSALINGSIDRSFIIHTRHLARAVDYFGFLNSKEIIVDGDIGHSCGQRMAGGSIVVKGSAGGWCGNMMSGGAITVHGSAGDFLGMRMESGMIRVLGGSGCYCGSSMKGGRLFLRGGALFGSGDEMRGGDIYIETLDKLWHIRLDESGADKRTFRWLSKA